MEAERMVLFDLDETLIDTNYNLRWPEDRSNPEEDTKKTRKVIARAISAGAKIGLNSDSALPTLRRWYQLLGMNGPIIAERGALVWLGQDQEEPEDISLTGARCIPEIKIHLINRVQKITNVQVFVGNYMELLSIIAKNPKIQRSIIINPYRQRSLSFHVCNKDAADKSFRDSQLLDEIVVILETILSELFPDLWNNIEVDKNPDYGVCILHDKRTRKTPAVSWLLNRLGLNKLFMVGNSMSDWISDDRVLHGAVGNSKPSFKAEVRKAIEAGRGGAIATGEFTAGAMELLDWALKV